MSGAADRQRAYRARRKQGVATFRVRLDTIDVAEMLLAGKLLAPGDADNHARVEAALERQIKLLCDLAKSAG